jgi:ornithine decarboxylase
MAKDQLRKAKEWGLDAYGISFHVGSQQTDLEQWDKALGQVSQMFFALAEEGVDLRMVNLGGGFPARYRAEVNGIEAYCEAVTRALVRHFGNRMPEVIIEPGRSMVGDAGVIQSEVVLVSRKAANERKRWVYLDIGKFSGLAETMGESIKYRLRTARDGTRVGPVVLAGPTCDSADVLYEKVPYDLPVSLEIGDKVLIEGTGAYTSTYASVAFNGFAPLKTIHI